MESGRGTEIPCWSPWQGRVLCQRSENLAQSLGCQHQFAHRRSAMFGRTKVNKLSQVRLEFKKRARLFGGIAI